jgi:glycosyltransferase involved in cell wall biosynthesis
MKIYVVIPHKFAGCGFYRQYQPHNHLAKQGIDVLLGAGLYDEDDQFVVEADIVHFHKGYIDLNGIKAAKERGMITIGDFDDWWFLDTEHILYKNYLKDDTSKLLIEFLRAVDYVTVTTDLLAKEAAKFNPNVIVLPNAMDMNYPNCEVRRVKEDRFVFGYLGGTCHGKDVEMLRGLSNRTGEFFRLMGFDGSPVYKGYADILSDSGKGRFDWLRMKNIWAYHQFYNCLDVSLVPLVDNKFNSLKSELKLIEAGFFKKGVIVSNVEPYRGLLRHKENCFVVNKPTDWVKGVKWYAADHDRVRQTGEELYRTVQPYGIDRVNEKRLKFYNDVLEKRNINGSDRHSRLQGVHG